MNFVELEKINEVEERRNEPFVQYSYTPFEQIEACLNNFDFIAGFLCSANISMFYGKPKSGKTFFVMDLALHVAMGRAFFGRDVEQGCVLYFTLEGQSVVLNRISAFKKYYECEEEVHPFWVSGGPVDLLNDDVDAQRICELAESMADHFKMPVAMIIIDTWSRANPGGQENTGDTNAAFANVDMIVKKTGAHVCLVHHEGKADGNGARGSNIMVANPDITVRVSKDKASKLHTASIEEVRAFAEDGVEFNFRIETVELGHNPRGDAVTSGVVIPSDEKMSNKSKLKGQAKKAYQVLIGLMLSPQAVKRAPKSGMYQQPCVQVKDYRGAFKSAGISEATDPDSINRSFNRQKNKLKDLGIIEEWDGWIWIVDKQDI